MRAALLFILLFPIAIVTTAQTFKLTGRITDANREPIAFASVQVKQLQSGTTTREDGTYAIMVEEGTYDIVYSIVGYKTQVITVAITRDYNQDIILEEDRAMLEGVIIKAKYKDFATEVIKNIIRRKDSLLASVGQWSCKAYIKASQEESSTKSKKQARKDTVIRNSNAELDNMAMAEVSLKLDYASEQKIKEERLGVKRSGSSEDLFYQSFTEGFFNFYNNLVKVPGLSSTQFLSPISYSGLLAYKFKTLKLERRGAYKWYTISVKPRLVSNATVEGELTVSDSNYTIEHCRFTFPKYHLPQYDFFQTEQWYSDTIPLLSKQQFTYYSKSGQHKLSGSTTVTYVDYELNKAFPKNYFGVEVSATAEEIIYWWPHPFQPGAGAHLDLTDHPISL